MKNVKGGPKPHVWTVKSVQDRCDIDHSDPDSCWIWRQCADVGGYPKAYIEGKPAALVSRWLLTHLGRRITGLAVSTICGEKRCLNPDHLRLITPSKLTKEGHKTRVYAAEYGRAIATKIANGQAKLTWEKADAIRASKDSSRDIAVRYGMSYSAICQVRRGATWRRPGMLG